MKKDKTEADIIKDFFEEYLKDYLDKNCIPYGELYGVYYFSKYIKEGFKEQACHGEQYCPLMVSLYKAFSAAEEYFKHEIQEGSEFI